MKRSARTTIAPVGPAAELADLRESVLHGLSLTPKRLPCKFFYDKRGSELFDRICELPEYYLTRTEAAIMRDNIDEIARALGPRCKIIEFGSGSSTKTAFLLDHLDDPVGYVPIDISHQHLLESAQRLSDRYPEIEVMPLSADFHEDVEIPRPKRGVRRRIAYFPGSTIGNFEDDAARRFLDRILGMIGEGGGLLIGFDLLKPVEILLPAYDDAAGVTAEFNLNILRRINRELDADIDVDRFRHRAVWNDAASRMEMHLESTGDQTAAIAGRTFRFEEGERILTEYSHKYALRHFGRLAASFELEAMWTDDRAWFCVQLLRPLADRGGGA